MAFTIDDIMQQLRALTSGGDYQGNGVTSFGAPTPSGPVTSGGMSNFGATAPVTSGFGMNAGTLGAGLQGLQSLNSLFQGNKAFGLARDQFKLQKELTNTNLNNSIKSYNTTLEDRLRSRGVAEGTDAATVQDEIDRKRLTR